MNRRTSLLPFAVAGFASAVLVSDAFQLGGSPSDGPIRGFVTLLTPLLTLAVGALALRPRFTPFAAALVAGLLSVLSAGAMALVISRVAWVKSGLSLPLGGSLLAASCVGPCLGLLAWLEQRAGRARADSLIADIDTRASWFALAALTAAASLALQLAEFVPSYGPRLASLGTGALATLMVLWFCGRSLWAWGTATAAEKAATRMAPTQSASSTLRLDLGLGEDLVEEAAGSSAYRSATVRKQIWGSPNVAVRVAKNHAMVAVALTALVVGGAAAVAFDSGLQALNHLRAGER